MKTIHQIVFLILIQWILFSCKETSNCDRLPSIIIEGNPDTVRVGEQYSAKMYLSDSCFFFVKETNSYIVPIMIVNDKSIKVSKGNWVNVSFQVEGDSAQKEKYINGHWIGEMIFPHPYGGDIRLSTRIDYVIENF